MVLDNAKAVLQMGRFSSLKRQVIWALFVVFGALHAGEGGEAGFFLRYGVGGRGLGMGRAFVAVANDASGIYWNPAGIIRAEQMEITSQYSNLYFDSQYAYLGFILPRPTLKTRYTWLRFLTGPETAWGLGWVNLGMHGFTQRDFQGRFLGHFGLSENALILAWAREWVGMWGVLGVGWNIKVVSQSFPELKETDDFIVSNPIDWTGGMDVGFLFQPIHFPILQIISLKYLLPLRLAVSFQNVVQPKWEASMHHAGFPRAMRAGFSYRIHLADWFSSSWKVTNSLKDVSILLALDHEKMKNGTSTYLGFEGTIPIYQVIQFSPRIGMNDQSEKISWGAGLCLPFYKQGSFRLDYAEVTHPILPTDHRFFFTFRFGEKRDARYFYRRARQSEIPEETVKKEMLRVITEYPNEFLEESAQELIQMDPKRVPRYYDLQGGLGKARFLFAQAIQFIKIHRRDQARKKAKEAVLEYMNLYQRPHSTLQSKDLTDFAKALIMSGNPKDAADVLHNVESSDIEIQFLKATAKRLAGDLEGALEGFHDLIKTNANEDAQHWVALAFFQIGEILMERGDYSIAAQSFDAVLRNFWKIPMQAYPYYLYFPDNQWIDDAFFLSGISKISGGDFKEGVSRIFELGRFYPKGDCGQLVEENILVLPMGYLQSDINVVKRHVEQWLETYSSNRR